MKKQVVVVDSKEQNGFVTLVIINGVLSAACGCGADDCQSDYDFTEMARRENLKRKLANKPAIVASPQSCDCGGTIKKIVVPVDSKYNRETGHRSHHTKRVLPKHHRETIRGMAAI